MNKQVEFRQGGILGWQGFYVIFNFVVKDAVCSHAIKSNDRWLIPRVVKAYTEHGWQVTLVCLDCILDAARELQDSE